MRSEDLVRLAQDREPRMTMTANLLQEYVPDDDDDDDDDYIITGANGGMKVSVAIINPEVCDKQLNLTIKYKML